MDESQRAEDKVVESTKDILEKWNDYYINNNFGIGVQCEKCKKWREVFQYQDRSEVPEVWICSMWKIDERRRGSCRIPSNLSEDDFGETLYSPGCLVWAKMDGYPWWPGMIEDCPDVQQYCMLYEDSEHEYHVNFFGDKPLRSWIKAPRIKDFSVLTTPLKKKHKGNLLRSIEQANEALKMSVKERLLNFSFAKRYKGRWGKLNKQEVILPPKKKEIKKSTGSRSQLTCSKPHVNPDSHRTSRIRKMKKNNLKVGAATKKKSKDEAVFQPIRSQEEKMEDSNNSGNQFPVSGEPGNKDQQRSFQKGFRIAKPQIQRVLNMKIRCCPVPETYYMQKLSLIHENSGKNSITRQSQQSEFDQSEDSDLAKYGTTLDLMFVSDTEEDKQSDDDHIFNENTEEGKKMNETKTSSITDRNSPIHNDPKIFSDLEDGANSTPECKAFLKFLYNTYPPLIKKFSIGTDTDNICSNNNSDFVIDSENVSTFSEKEPTSNDENETACSRNELVNNNETQTTFWRNESVNNDENETTFWRNEPVNNDENETTLSGSEPVNNDENDITLSGSEPVNNDENETTLSGSEPFNNDESETTLSGSEPVNDKNDVYFLDEETIIDENEANFSETKSFINDESAATFSENDLVIDDENTGTILESVSDAPDPCSNEKDLSAPKNEKHSDRCETAKKNRKFRNEMIFSYNCKNMPYSFYQRKTKN